MPQLSITSFICFGLIILCVGYVAVEIFGWNNYRFKNVLERNKRHLFDRILHYIIRWGIINIIFIILNPRNRMETMIKEINSLRELANIFSINGQNLLETQFIIFSIRYFITVVFISSVFFYVGKYSSKLWQYMGYKINAKKIKK